MAKTPTLTSNLLGIGSNQQQSLIGSDLSNIGFTSTRSISKRT